MRKPIAVLSALALAAGTVAGCGDDDESTDVGPVSPAQTSPGGEAPQTTGTGKVGMRNLRFDPEEITVEKGQKITWVNNESIQHNVVAEKGADFESELLDQDQTFEFTPEDEGTIEYVCTLHPGMDGKVTVTG